MHCREIFYNFPILNKCFPSTRNSLEYEQKQKSRQLDVYLSRERKNYRNTVRTLLLGPGESGKSTFLKQMIYLLDHEVLARSAKYMPEETVCNIKDKEFTPLQQLKHRCVIWDNMLEGMRQLVLARRSLDDSRKRRRSDNNSYAFEFCTCSKRLSPEQSPDITGPLINGINCDNLTTVSLENVDVNLESDMCDSPLHHRACHQSLSSRNSPSIQSSNKNLTAVRNIHPSTSSADNLSKINYATASEVQSQNSLDSTFDIACPSCGLYSQAIVFTAASYFQYHTRFTETHPKLGYDHIFDPSNDGVDNSSLFEEWVNFFLPFATHLKVLWSSSAIQRVYAEKDIHRLKLLECHKYFLDRLELIGQKDYMPSSADILNARRPTRRPEIDNFFQINKVRVNMIDCGGQRKVRSYAFMKGQSTSTHLDFTAIIFFIPLGDFNVRIWERNVSNEQTPTKLEEAIQIFTSLVNNRSIRHNLPAFICFLNKFDIYEEKVRNGVDFKQYEPNYEGNLFSKKDLENYFCKKFNKIQTEAFRAADGSVMKEEFKSLTFHCMNATDTNYTKIFYSNIKDIILSNTIRELLL